MAVRMSHEVVSPESVGVHPQRLRVLVDRVRADVEHGPLPSAQVAVARRGRLVASQSFGGVSNSTRYVLQSAGRPVLATVAWKLMSDGLVDLDERVGDIIPEFATNGKDVVTVRQVLTHTAGFPMAPLGFPKMKDRRLRLEAFSRWRLTSEPGTELAFHLTSAGWVLAEICERRGGRPIPSFLQEAISDPLGLGIELGVPVERQDSVAPLLAIGLPPGEEPPIDPWGPFYLRDPDVLAAGEPSHSIVASAEDVALLFQALYSSGLWSPEAVAEGTREQVAMTASGGYGTGGFTRMGVFVLLGGSPTMSPSSFGHGGAPSQLSWHDPETGVSFCFTTNRYPATGYDIGRSGANRSTVLSTLAGDLVD
jgi:CubicO group peptidase (beta-lactamase class C family)